MSSTWLCSDCVCAEQFEDFERDLVINCRWATGYTEATDVHAVENDGQPAVDAGQRAARAEGERASKRLGDLAGRLAGRRGGLRLARARFGAVRGCEVGGAVCDECHRAVSDCDDRLDAVLWA